MSAFALWLARAVLHLAPSVLRDAVLGDLLEEHATIVAPRVGAAKADLWLMREVLRSATPLALARARRAGPTRVALAGAAAVGAAAATHAAGTSAWSMVLAQVPLRAWHAAPRWWSIALFVVEGVVAALAAALIVKGRFAGRGGRR